MLPKTRTTSRRDLMAVAVVASLLACSGDIEPDPNRAPSVAKAIPDQLMTEGDTVTLDLSSHFTDADGDSLTYTATTSNAGVLSASVSGSRLTLVAVAPGTATVTVTATDPDGLEASQDFDATVQRRNRAPTATDPIPDQLMTEGDTVTLDLSSHFTDADGDSLTYIATTSNAGVLSASVSGSRLTLVAVVPGTAKVTVAAADPDGLEASQDFDATVEHRNRAPTLTDSIPDQVLIEGETVTVDLALHFEDPDGDSITYEATSSDQDLLAVEVSGSRLSLKGVRAGTVTVTATANDPDGLSTSQDFEAVVEENGAPVVDAEIGDLALEQDEYVILQLSSYFSDPDDHPLTYTAVPSDTTVVSVSIDGDTLTIGSGAPGETIVEITATDPGGLSAGQTSEVEVDVGFSVDFTDLDTLVHWRLQSGIASELSDDGLRLTRESGCGHAYKRIRSRLSEWWSMTASIGREETSAAAYVMVGTSDSTYRGYRLLIGSGMLWDGQSVNYRLDGNENGSWLAMQGGFSDELDDLGYELNEVTVEYSAGSDTLVGRADTIDLVALELAEEGHPPAIATGDTGFGLCDLEQGGTDSVTVLVESAHLEGGDADTRRRNPDLEPSAAVGATSETVRPGRGRTVPATPVPVLRSERHRRRFD